MRLVAIENNLQVFTFDGGENFMLQNTAEKDFAFKRVKVSRADVRRLRILLETIIEKDEEKADENI
jgi:hypothetical protein